MPWTGRVVISPVSPMFSLMRTGRLLVTWYLLDVQAHYAISGELVQGGQLLVMQIPPGKNLG